MILIYNKPKEYWNNVFSKEEVKVPTNPVIPIKALEQGMNWLIADGDKVLDFGCGNGTLLFYADLKGASDLFGIDISEAGIALAKQRAEFMSGHYNFTLGGVNILKTIDHDSINSVILSNIIDNLTEEDMSFVLREVQRILKTNGKLIVKINDFIEEKDYEKHKIKVISHDLLDDGLLLLNKTTDKWRDIFRQWFHIEKELMVYFEKYDMSNRMFLLKK